MLDAAKAMKLSAKDLLELNIIDEIISEPLGGAHREKDVILEKVKASISKNLDFFKEMTGEEITSHRKNKFLKIGRGKGFVNNPESLSATQLPSSKLKEIFYSKKDLIIVTISIILVSLFLFSIL